MHGISSAVLMAGLGRGGSAVFWLIGIVVSIWFLMRLTRARQMAPRHGSGTPALSREEVSRLKTTLDRTLVDAAEQMREMMGLLSTKAEVVNQLIIEADERIRELRRLESGAAQQRDINP